MAEITFSGLASGIATDDIVEKLMALERRPVDRLEKEKTYETNRLKAYGQLNLLLNELREAVAAMNLTSEVRTTKAALNSTDALTATSNSAQTGSYNVVVTQLAQVQKTVTDGYSSSTDSLFGSGSISVNGTQIAIDSTNNSLSGIMSAINAEFATTGVSATIINDGTGGVTAFRLVLTGKDASTNFNVTDNLVDGSGNPIAFNTTNTQTAQQAKIQVDGIDVVGNSNTITGVIAGVTLNLSNTSPIAEPGPPPVYTPTRMDITADTDALKEKISTFVSSYNKIMEWIGEGYQEDLGADAESDTSDTEEESLSFYLRGDATVNSIKRSLQNILTEAVGTNGSLQILSQIGISTNKDGTLNLNSSKLDTALADNFDDITKLLAGDGMVKGVMEKFNTRLLDITSATTGMYADQKDRYESRIDRLDAQIEQKTFMLEKREAMLLARFNAMELLVSNLNSQSSYITQFTNMLNKEK
ncbi:MAG: flagellar filament capping protein FliD [Desulfobulbaceae bacterium]|nr:MAG: flagellar filament capping protein FliD [Desulfobulbaceae bacterium]